MTTIYKHRSEPSIVFLHLQIKFTKQPFNNLRSGGRLEIYKSTPKLLRIQLNIPVYLKVYLRKNVNGEITPDHQRNL